MIIVPEDNIVSEEESFVNNENDIHKENIDEEVAVADIDDVIDQDEETMYTRPTRENPGVGVERIQMDFHGREYGTKREFNFVTNVTKKSETNVHTTQRTYIQLACNIIFTQMHVIKGFKNMGRLQ